MRLLADENIPRAALARLRAAGHDVLEAGAASPDADIAALAAREQRTLLTQDKNLANILEYPPGMYPGIILLRIHPPLLEDISKALERLFSRFPPDKFGGKLFVLDREGIRIRE